ncbi:MAG: tRNA1(Val) (adenine(37)-N6)-methyltransferase [Bacilli bacterium]|nr:tRNA1(Val) (adenine(37)-N6)-methyltransferase [Bacilli bacterium]
MEVIHDLLGYDGLKIIQSTDAFRFSLDSLLLADFVKVRVGIKRIIDIGCGNAPIPLFLTLKTNCPIMGVEIQEALANQALRSVALNHCDEQITILAEDARILAKKEAYLHAFDIAIANPPYFPYTKSSHVNKKDALTIARHEVHLTLQELVAGAKDLLADYGYFYLIHRTLRLEEIIDTLKQARFKTTRMRFIHSRKEDAAELVLIEAKKMGKSELVIEPPLVIYQEGSEYSPEVSSIFHFKK